MLLTASSSLTRLHIRGNALCDDGLRALGQGLGGSKSLRHLGLGFNEITAGAEGWASLIAGLGEGGNTRLYSLSLDKNELDGECAGGALGRALGRRGCPLMSLRVSRSCITRAGVVSLAAGLAHNTRLNSLELSECALGGGEGTALAEGLQSNTSLGLLSLASNNRLDAAAAEHIARALTAQPSLHELIMYNTSIGDAGARALAGVLGHPLCALFRLTFSAHDHAAFGHQAALEVARAAKAHAFRREYADRRAFGAIVRGVRFSDSWEELGLPEEAAGWGNGRITRYWEVSVGGEQLGNKLTLLATALLGVREGGGEEGACWLLMGAEDVLKKVAEMCWEDVGELPLGPNDHFWDDECPDLVDIDADVW